MADDDDLNLEDSESSEAPVGKKRGGLGALLPSLLKWVAIAIGAVVFIVTVVVITFNIMSKNSAGKQTAVPASQEYVGKREVFSWYTAIGQIKAKTSDPLPASVVVEVALGYKLDDKATPAEISSRSIEIKDFLRRFFMQKTIEDLRPYNEEKLKIEIRNAINDDILSTSKISDVRFITFDVVEQ